VYNCLNCQQSMSVIPAVLYYFCGLFVPSALLVGAFTSRSTGLTHIKTSLSPTLITHQLLSSARQSKIIDAEVIPDDNIEKDNESLDQAMSLIEYSQNQDKDWKSMPVAFCCVSSNTYIDCNLAFYVKDPQGDVSEGAEYALGVPCEVPIVIALELEDDPVKNQGQQDNIDLSTVIPLSPDGSDDTGLSEEDKEVVFQLAARALKDEYGSSIRLKKTPRVLTVEGDIDAIIGDWKEVLQGNVSGNRMNNFTVDDALETYDEDDDDDFFDTIMRRDLGEDYMDRAEDDGDDTGIELDEELLKLFDSEEIDVDLDELIAQIDTKENEIKEDSYEELVQTLSPSASLKLINFPGPGGNEYAIMKPLRPILLVAKEDPTDYTRRILLNNEERDTILPRLERACRKSLSGEIIQ